MAGPANAADLWHLIYDNYTRIGVLLTQVVSNPTQANIDALTTLVEGPGIVRPKITTSVDGESYDWLAYQVALPKLALDAKQNWINAEGPFFVQSRAR